MRACPLDRQLERPDALRAEHLRAHDSREVKTLGDGFFATFAPSDAVRCIAVIRAAVGILGSMA